MLCPRIPLPFVRFTRVMCQVHKCYVFLIDFYFLNNSQAKDTMSTTPCATREQQLRIPHATPSSVNLQNLQLLCAYAVGAEVVD